MNVRAKLGSATKPLNGGKCYNDLNSEGPYTLTEDSYAALDHSIMGWDTIADAKQIAAALVAKTSVDGVATGTHRASTTPCSLTG